jgi:hypothetical protein
VFLPNAAFSCLRLATRPEGVAYVGHGGPPSTQHPSAVPLGLDTTPRDDAPQK